MIQTPQTQTQKDCFITCGQGTVTVDFSKIGLTSTKLVQCVLILNSQKQEKTANLIIQSSKNILIADGGANSFYESQNRDDKRLKAIIGDLDSIKPQVLEYYKNRGIDICQIQDQNQNDFEKSLIKSKQLGYKINFCVGALGSRMDQTLSSMHIATKFGRQNKEIDVILLGESNLMYFVKPNLKYKIKVSNWMRRRGCGLITFNKIQKIQTTGFKWNLGAQHQFASLQWGQFISTSNQIVQNQITIFSSNQLFFVCCTGQTK